MKIAGYDHEDFLSLVLFVDAFIDVARKENPRIAEKVARPGRDLIETVSELFEDNDLDIWDYVDSSLGIKLVGNLDKLWNGVLMADDLFRFDRDSATTLALQAGGHDVSLQDDKRVAEFLKETGVKVPSTDDLGVSLDQGRYVKVYSAIKDLKKVMDESINSDLDCLFEGHERSYISQAVYALRCALKLKKDPEIERMVYELERR